MNVCRYFYNENARTSPRNRLNEPSISGGEISFRPLDAIENQKWIVNLRFALLFIAAVRCHVSLNYLSSCGELYYIIPLLLQSSTRPQSNGLEQCTRCQAQLTLNIVFSLR